MFLEFIAHDHQHYREHQIHVQYVLSFHQELVHHKLSPPEWQVCEGACHSEMLEAFIKIADASVLLRIRQIVALNQLESGFVDQLARSNDHVHPDLCF